MYESTYHPILQQTDLKQGRVPYKEKDFQFLMLLSFAQQPWENKRVCVHVTWNSQQKCPLCSVRLVLEVDFTSLPFVIFDFKSFLIIPFSLPPLLHLHVSSYLMTYLLTTKIWQRRLHTQGSATMMLPDARKANTKIATLWFPRPSGNLTGFGRSSIAKIQWVLRS